MLLRKSPSKEKKKSSLNIQDEEKYSIMDSVYNLTKIDLPTTVSTIFDWLDFPIIIYFSGRLDDSEKLAGIGLA